MSSGNSHSLKNIDYKNVDVLKSFLDDHGQLQGRRKTGLTAKKQRRVAREVKRARFMGFLPYLAK